MFTGEQLKKTKFEKIESILFALTAGGILSVLIYNLFHFDQLKIMDDDVPTKKRKTKKD